MYDSNNAHQELLHFWGIGDLHFRANAAWNEYQTPRFARMFADLHDIWQQEGEPAFCASAGDQIDTCAREDYTLAQGVLTRELGAIPFYPCVGNHEYHGPGGEDPTRMGEMFTRIWGYPLRYSWQHNTIICIMLDYPDPLTQEEPSKFISLMPETLAFLDDTLAVHAEQPAIVFLHCPLRNTVLDRNPGKHLDYNSTQSFFSPENSQQVRDILARYGNVRLFFSGHTHSGWQASGLVKTEELGGRPVTFVNLSSPWYTGYGHGPRLTPDLQVLHHIPDDPDTVPSFSIRIFQDEVRIKVRDHLTRQWLKEWTVPFEG
jgi:3',5'-cyclic AMP phosphodiesterase CpdA